MRISEVLRAKAAAGGADGTVTIAPDADVRTLLSLLAQHDIGAVVVSADGTGLDGIVSERDVVRELTRDEAVLSRPVRSIMTTAVHTCEPSEPVDALAAQMTERRVRHVPVVADGALVGVVSIGDIVKQRIAELQFERDQLDAYVQ